MLSIRLSRIGKKKQPIYRVIVTEKHRDPWGKALEILGNYDPRSADKKLDLKADRVKHWLSVGAQPSATVKNLLIKEGLLSGDKAKGVKISKKRQVKLDEKNGAAKEAAEAAKEAAKEAKAEKATEEATPAEAPKEEAKVEEAAPAEVPTEAEEKTEK